MCKKCDVEKAEYMALVIKQEIMEKLAEYRQEGKEEIIGIEINVKFHKAKGIGNFVTETLKKVFNN